MRIAVRAAATVLSLGLVLSACGGNGRGDGDAGGPVTLTWESYNYGSSGLGGAGTEQLIEKFEAEHPDIDIDPVGTPSSDIHTSVQARTAAGQPPDLVQLGWSKFSFALENLPLVPVDDIAPAGEWEAHTAGIVSQAMAMGEVDGKVMAMPYTISTPTLIYNASLLEAAGLDPARPPATWAEAREAALAITERTDAEGMYVSAANAAKSDFLTQSLIASNGGEFLTGDGEVAFDGPEAVEAIAMLGDLTRSGAQPAVSEDDATALFESGRLGMYVTSTALLAGLVEASEGSFTVDTAPMPAFEGKPARPSNSGSGLFVLAQEEAEQRAAWEFVKFLTGERGFTIIASQIGYLPLRPAILEDPEYLAGFIAEDPRLLPAIEQLEHLEPYRDLPGPNATQAREVLQDEAVEPVLMGTADPTEAMTAAADRVRELLG